MHVMTLRKLSRVIGDLQAEMTARGEGLLEEIWVNRDGMDELRSELSGLCGYRAFEARPTCCGVRLRVLGT